MIFMTAIFGVWCQKRFLQDKGTERAVTTQTNKPYSS
jgi:hypothetical protein